MFHETRAQHLAGTNMSRHSFMRIPPRHTRRMPVVSFVKVSLVMKAARKGHDLHDALVFRSDTCLIPRPPPLASTPPTTLDDAAHLALLGRKAASALGFIAPELTRNARCQYSVQFQNPALSTARTSTRSLTCIVPIGARIGNPIACCRRTHDKAGYYGENRGLSEPFHSFHASEL